MTAATDFAPVTLNGEPIVTWCNVHYIEIDGRFYEQEFAATECCYCRRCSLHDDPGGCIPAEAMWGLVTFLADA